MSMSDDANDGGRRFRSELAGREHDCTKWTVEDALMEALRDVRKDADADPTAEGRLKIGEEFDGAIILLRIGGKYEDGSTYSRLRGIYAGMENAEVCWLLTIELRNLTEGHGSRRE